MANTSIVQPLGLTQQLDIVIEGHTFQISVVVLRLAAPGVYPLLLGRPWLRMDNIQQNWWKNVLTSRNGKTKIRVSTQVKVATKHDCILSLYAESINMMEGLDDGEVNQNFEKKPKNHSLVLNRRSRYSHNIHI